MENIPLSQYFVLTDKKEDLDFTAINWLSKQDEVIIEQIIELSDTFFSYSNDDNDAEPSFDCVDYLTFCHMIAEKEVGEPVTEKDKENAMMGMALFAVYESMRRKQFITFVGTGRVSEFGQNSTEIELTEIGKIVGGSIKTLADIAQQMEES